MFGKETDKRCLEIKSFLPTPFTQGATSFKRSDKCFCGYNMISLYIEDIQDILQMTNLIFKHEM